MLPHGVSDTEAAPVANGAQAAGKQASLENPKFCSTTMFGISCGSKPVKTDDDGRQSLLVACSLLSSVQHKLSPANAGACFVLERLQNTGSKFS